ncbi:hypothetical protein BIZ37_16550 [Photobacterium sp. BZF1]|uniref:hypothetical protein n=1 Tax=Photobacterium sp. BZF1 TaxID=1904457 RepID=UPI00165395F2|nr:hypothetical protein [Photobacterium sp. BZF1]MBC7004175.1 hypothetical protein [Photobacterium sp. BZF1]
MQIQEHVNHIIRKADGKQHSINGNSVRVTRINHHLSARLNGAIIPVHQLKSLLETYNITELLKDCLKGDEFTSAEEKIRAFTGFQIKSQDGEDLTSVLLPQRQTQINGQTISCLINNEARYRIGGKRISESDLEALFS